MRQLEAFRRARGLLAAEDLQAWLAAAGLGVEEWVERVLAGDTAGLPGPLPPPPRAAVRRRPLPLPPDAEPPPQVWTEAERGCGDAALRVVCRALGAAPARSLGGDATLAEIVAAGRAAGLPAAALKVSRHRAGELPVPWIAHVDGGHWIVVHSVGAGDVVVSDPAQGAGTLQVESFRGRWSGWCAVFAPVVHSH